MRSRVDEVADESELVGGPVTGACGDLGICYRTGNHTGWHEVGGGALASVATKVPLPIESAGSQGAFGTHRGRISRTSVIGNRWTRVPGRCGGGLLRRLGVPGTSAVERSLRASGWQ